MRENGKVPEATSASTEDELLKVLIEKVVENGSKITQVKDQIHKLQEPSAEAKAVDQRMAVLEEHSGTIKEGVEELKKRLVDLDTTRKSMTDLQTDLQRYVHIFEHPKLKEVHHKHFLGRPALILFLVSAIITTQIIALARSWDKEAKYEENDIKWRSAILSEDSIVTMTLTKCQRDYNANADQFRKDVVAEEERRAELYQRWLQEQEDVQKIRELQDAKKKKY
jgi:hypothetical protein